MWQKNPHLILSVVFFTMFCYSSTTIVMPNALSNPVACTHFLLGIAQLVSAIANAETSSPAKRGYKE